MAKPFQQSAEVAMDKELGTTAAVPESTVLTVGGIAALLVGACCVGPDRKSVG